MDVRSRLARERYGRALDAAERWRKRDAVRAENKREIAAGGEGAADTLKRQQQFADRERVRATALTMSDRGLLPRHLERRIGPSLDWQHHAPSELARRAGRPVARITQMPERGVLPEAVGTGFMVSPCLMMTNHHVTPSARDAAGLGANFFYEYDDRGLKMGRFFELDPDTFFFSHEELDFALVATKRKSRDDEELGEIGHVPLIEATPKILVGQPVNIIQHPEGRAKTYAFQQNRLVDILDEGFLHYETDTLAGSSGSPAFSSRWELVALHHCGIPMVRDGRIMTRSGAVWDPEKMSDDEVEWFANEGTRVSFIVGALRNVRMPGAAQQKLLEELLGGTDDPLRSVERLAGGTGAQHLGGAMMPINHFTFSGPVTIHVHGSAGSAIAPAQDSTTVHPATQDPAFSPSVQEKKQNFDPNYLTRKGYDPDFLGIHLPMPEVAEERADEMYRGDQGEVIRLPYHHFSIVMNQARQTCMLAASNADYNEDQRDERPRKAFGGEDWRLDPRVPAELQIEDKEFYRPAGRIDRGHIVRREDNCWGASRLEREYANADSYHWTNCTPQHEAFNQERARKPEYKEVVGLWGALESHLVRQLNAVGRRATIFAGPILAHDDPGRDFGSGHFQYPTRFWKVVCVARQERGAAKLYVYGFILDQGDVIRRFGIERIDVGAFAAHQRSLAAIQDETGLRFAPEILAGDVMSGESEPHGLEGSGSIRGIPAGGEADEA